MGTTDGSTVVDRVLVVGKLRVRRKVLRSEGAVKRRGKLV